MRAVRPLLTVETIAYHYVLFLVARLPSRIAYGLGRIAGDLQFHVESSNRKMILECLGLVFGNQISLEGRIRVVHDCFRLGACAEIDRARLAGNGEALSKLVEVRGLEHLERARSQGKGAVIGSSHFGSWEAEVGLLGALGFPVTLISYGWSHRRLARRMPSFRPQRFISHLSSNSVRRYLRPRIYVDEGRRKMVVAEATRAVQQNQLVFIMLDVVGTPSRHPNSVPIPFLNGLAYVPAGAVRIAKASGAQLLICLLHRSPDLRHQVMEITAPIPTEGSIDEVNRNCLQVIESTIRKEPAHWRSWDYKTMAKIGLLPEEEMKRLVHAASTSA